MKLKLPTIQTQIVLALIIGAFFGAVFNVSSERLLVSISSKSGEKVISVEEWDEFTVIASFENKTDSVIFNNSQQMQIISHFKSLDKKKSEAKEGEALKSIKTALTHFNYSGSDSKTDFTEFANVSGVKREKTIATSIRWLGDIFIRLLNMIAIPLVLASLIVGAASLGDTKRFARIGGKTITFYMLTTAFAVTTGLLIANILEPGERMPADTRDKLISVYNEDYKEKVSSKFDFDVVKEIVNIVPKNPIDAMASGNMLQIVFFAVFFGLMLSLIAKEKIERMVGFFDALSDTMIKMVDTIMKIAPLGVFALIASTVSEFGFEVLGTLVWYSFAVVLGLIIHTFITYTILLKIFSKMPITRFFKGIRRAMTIAFSTSSSAATLPVTMECCNDNLGVPKSITSFVLPLGATINMDGTALYQGVAAVFIAQVFGLELNLVQQLTIVLTGVLASIGTAPVPGVGIIMMIIILKSVGIPQEGIALILGVDRILDMCRTITNITGDALASVIIADSENVLNVNN